MPIPAAVATLETTRERLLEAAGAAFAERGFRQATVRDICRRAGANIAAVNYHFGGKQRLYAETLTYGAQVALAKFPPDAGLRQGASPADALHTFVLSFLRRFLEIGTPEWHGTLCARELMEPTAALDDLVREVIAPLARRLQDIVRALLGPSASDGRVRLAALSVVGQCLLYRQNRPVVERLFGPQVVSGRETERLARHITEFSLGALRHLRQTAKARGPA
jgi:AcrR family transcriptional regulator